MLLAQVSVTRYHAPSDERPSIDCSGPHSSDISRLRWWFVYNCPFKSSISLNVLQSNHVHLALLYSIIPPSAIQHRSVNYLSLPASCVIESFSLCILSVKCLDRPFDLPPLLTCCDSATNTPHPAVRQRHRPILCYSEINLAVLLSF